MNVYKIIVSILILSVVSFSMSEPLRSESKILRKTDDSGIFRAGSHPDSSGSDKKNKEPDLVQYVNTLQGSHNIPEFSHGRCSPLVGYPHGGNFWSPSGFSYVDRKVGGLGGNGFSLVPLISKSAVTEKDAASSFNPKNVLGQPHYFKMTAANGITSEMSPTERCAIFQFSYPRSKEAVLAFNGPSKMNEMSIDTEKHQLKGYITNKVWHAEKFYKTYFILQFDQPFVSYGTSNIEAGALSENKQTDNGPGVGAYVQFKKGAKVQVKASISNISLEQAQTTFDQEIEPYGFAAIKDKTYNAWNKMLNKIVIEGGTLEQRKTFYSCLFRANLRPGKVHEIDKDGNPHFYYDEKVHDGQYLSNPILWDAYRSLFPLQNIINTSGQEAYVKSLQRTKPLTGWWPSGHVMIGNHAISVFADAWAKGIRTFDPDSVLKYYHHEITHSKLDSISNSAYNIEHQRGYGRMGFEDYFTLGYIPYPKNSTSVAETTSRTLEYNYDDFCAYRLAKMTGNEFYEDVYRKLLYQYRNVFDKTDNFFKGRDVEGNWIDFNPYEWGGPFVEGNGWQWKFALQHDTKGMIDLIGGDEQFAEELDELFEVPSDSVLHGGYGFMIHEINEAVAGGQGQYAQGNEPCFHVIYLYDYVGQPWKAQKLIRESLTKLYNSGPKGFPGDEDGGAMSSFYVLSALGFYSVTPGTDQYALGSPLFDKATINLENGKKFTIVADNNIADNVYIESATLNGRPYSKNYLHHDDIMNGSELHFTMGNRPNTQRGNGIEDRPFSISDTEK